MAKPVKKLLAVAGLISGGITDPAFLDAVGPWAVAQVEAAELRTKRPPEERDPGRFTEFPVRVSEG